MFAKMFSSRGVMTEFDDVAVELFIVGNVEFFLVINKSMLLFPL
jgi:hypothetical protein